MDLIETAGVSSGHRHPWELARLWVLRRLIDRHVPLADGATIVDIGCGDAFVIGELAKSFPHAQIFGVDAAFTDDVVRARQAALPRNVRLLRDLDAIPANGAALVLLIDVLEHIEDDHRFLIDLLSRPVIGPRTQFIVTVPAYQSLFSSHDVFLKHFRRYTNTELRRRLESAGLCVSDIGYFFASLLPLRLAGVLKERMRPPRTIAAGTGLTTYGGSTVGTWMLSGLLKADALAALTLRRIGISIPGLSNYAVCRTSV